MQRKQEKKAFHQHNLTPQHFFISYIFTLNFEFLHLHLSAIEFMTAVVLLIFLTYAQTVLSRVTCGIESAISVDQLSAHDLYILFTCQQVMQFMIYYDFNILANQIVVCSIFERLHFFNHVIIC